MDGAWQSRTHALLGDAAMIRLKEAKVVIAGLGGVGSYAYEALVRAGVGHLTLIDHDTVEASNINRQLVASHDTIGKAKVEIAKAHGLRINPEVTIMAHPVFVTKENADALIPKNTDMIIDAIDSVDAKTDLIVYASKHQIPIISAMGTANKRDPMQFKFGDIFKTSVDPLAKVMRKRLKDAGVASLPVVYSTETPDKAADGAILGSVSYIPSVCGLMMAAKAVGYLLNGEWS